eukprot:scaffold38025_cov25-Tisochrysis_lutea.AAC.6
MRSTAHSRRPRRSRAASERTSFIHLPFANSSSAAAMAAAPTGIGTRARSKSTCLSHSSAAASTSALAFAASASASASGMRLATRTLRRARRADFDPGLRPREGGAGVDCKGVAGFSTGIDTLMAGTTAGARRPLIALPGG